MPLKFWSKDYIYNVDTFCIFIQHLLANLFIMPADERLFNNEAISDKHTHKQQITSNLHANIFNMHRKCLY